MRALAISLAAATLAACGHGPSTPVAISVPSSAPQGLRETANDAAGLLAKLLHHDVPVVDASGSAKQLIALQLGDASCPASGKGAEAYAIQSSDSKITVCSDGQLGLEFGLYALLEQQGIRYFHPEETFIPASAPATLTVKSVTATPSLPHRGFHLHTVHPIPMLAALHFTGKLNQQLVDDYLRWLVRNRQDYLQWALIKVPDMEGARTEARYAVDRGHALGIQVGINPLLWSGGLSDLQNGYALFPASDPDWKTTLHASLDWLLQVPFDRLDVALGEFQQSSDTGLVQWIDETQAYVAQISPSTQVMWTSHVGDVGVSPNYGVYYYFVPQFCSAQVGLFVHTVMLYDLNGPAPCYNQTDFHLQRDFLLQELSQRPTWFFPESAYWLTTDSPIPYFMSGYLVGRSNDLAYLAKSAPGLQGHVTFTSADEWDYWLTDYLVAHETYDGPQPLDAFLADTFAPLGPGGVDLGHAVASEATTQWSDLVGRALLPYVAGEDGTDKLGYQSGIYNHAPRVPFTTIMAMSAADLDAFESGTLADVKALATHERSALAQVQALSGELDASADGWRQELADGLEINALRAEHSAAMYEAAIAAARSKLDGQDRSAEIAQDQAQARAATAQAAVVVARREPHYRYGTQELASGKNPTEYPYGAEYHAHTLELWTSQEDDLAAALAQ